MMSFEMTDVIFSLLSSSTDDPKNDDVVTRRSRRKLASTGASLRRGLLPGNRRRRHRTVPRERLARGDRLRAEKFGREKERAKLDGVAFVKGKQFFVSFLFPSLAI